MGPSSGAAQVAEPWGETNRSKKRPCCKCWASLTPRGRCLVVCGIVIVVLAAVGGIVAAIFILRRTPRHSPSPGYGRPIPPWIVYPGPYDVSPGAAPRYPVPSALYAVNVSFSFMNGSIAAAAQPAFVYYNSIDGRRGDNGADAQRPGQSVSWAGFSFDASLVYADVSIATSFSFTACILRPLSYGLSCQTDAGGTVARVRLPRSPAKVSVELYADAAGNSAAFIAQPLFLFPDAPEDPTLVPAPSDRGVLYYARGVHNLSGQVSLACGTNNVYLEPGAYVSGGFKTTCSGGPTSAAEQTIISGRGVITGEQFPWHSPLFEWALVNIDQGTQNVIDGLVLVDSPEFHVASFANRPTVRNVKMMSWPYNSDGFDTGSGGLAEDLFIKANDDSIKISGGSDSLVQRVVVWQQLNGAVIQMGWVSPLNWQRVTVREIDVIHVCYCCRADGGCDGSDNEAIVDLAPDGTSVFGLADIAISDVRVESDAVRVLYIQMPAGATGSIARLSLANVSAPRQSLPARWGMPSNVLAVAPGAGGSIAGVALNNVLVGGPGACAGRTRRRRRSPSRGPCRASALGAVAGRMKAKSDPESRGVRE